jgi:hypothetical protein
MSHQKTPDESDKIFKSYKAYEKDYFKKAWKELYENQLVYGTDAGLEVIKEPGSITVQRVNLSNINDLNQVNKILYKLFGKPIKKTRRKSPSWL